MDKLVIGLFIALASCSPVTTIMVVEVLDSTKYVRCARMNSTELYFIKLKGVKEGDIKDIKVKRLKTEY